MSKIPKKIIGGTLFAILLLIVFHWQTPFFNDRFNMDPAYPWLATYLLGFITFVAWGIWTILVVRQRLIGFLILFTPVLFFILYQPIIGGDMNLTGLKPRFWSNQVDYAVSETANVNIDLKTTTSKDFDQFLGPQRNGRIENVKLTDLKSTPPERLWKINIGEAWSGFVVVNGFAITQEQRGANECVTCYDAETGELKWIYQMPRRHEDLAGLGKVGPRATPTVHGGMVYAMGGTGILDCLDGNTGELSWSADIPSLVGIQRAPHTNSQGIVYTSENSTLMWGRSQSPLIVDDLVVVAAGGPKNASLEQDNDPTATLIAFDTKTGKEEWRGGKRMVSYASPSLATLDGQRQILLTTEQHAAGFDPETGRELWSHSRPGKSDEAANSSQITVVDDNRLILSKGYGLGGELIRVSQADATWTVESLHNDRRVLKTKLTNPVVYQGHVYSLSDGILECIEIDSFHRKWRKRGNFKNGQILLVCDILLVHSETNGKLTMVDADPSRYTQRGAFNTIDGLGWNTLCQYGDLLLVRTEKEAACFRLPVEKP